MELQLFAYPFIVLTLLCFLNGLDYWEDYRNFYSWGRYESCVRYANHLKKHACMCWCWAMVWAIGSGTCWYYETIRSFILA